MFSDALILIYHTAWRHIRKDSNLKWAQNLYSSQNIIKVTKLRIRWAGRTARVRMMENAYKILVGNHEEKR
jgi:hypothetical protein